MTSYAVFYGRGPVRPAGDGGSPRSPTGRRTRLMVVESADGVPWTKPDDLPRSNARRCPGVPLFGAGSKHPGGFNALFADGSVRFIKTTINPQTFRALITRAGGEVISRGCVLIE